MSKNKIKNLSAAIQSLRNCIDRLEGEYSNIPDCCIEQYIAGQTYISLYNSINVKDQKKLQKWDYVPCQKCFKNNKRNKLKEGTSDIGCVLYSILDLLNERKNNA